MGPCAGEGNRQVYFGHGHVTLVINGPENPLDWTRDVALGIS